MSEKDNRIIVTGTDETYFPLAVELVQSIRANEKSRGIHIGVIDAGITQAQTKELVEVYGCIVKRFEPKHERLQRAISKRPALAVNLAKLWLDQLFPDYETLIFLDADSWVQDWKAIDWLVGGAGHGALAVVPTWNRYRGRFPIYWVLGLLPMIRTFNLKAAYHAGLKLSVLRRVGEYADVNAGVFAIRRDAPHWQRMRHWQEIVLKRGRPFTSDGLSMALACHVDGCSLQLLPEFCNYVGDPLYDPGQKALVDRYFPHAPVGVMHFANQKIIRFDKTAVVETAGTDGKVYPMNIRFNAEQFNVY